jgi:hypothetical protein
LDVKKTAVVRITRTVDDEGFEWHSVVLDIGALHREPPVAFRTIGGLCTFLADMLVEELNPSTRTTEPELLPVEVT